MRTSLPALRRSRQRGAAIIEFALSWSIMWFLFFGVYQFGYSFYVYNSLMTSIANAAQMGSKMPYDTSNPAQMRDWLKNLAVYGDPAPTSTDKPIVPNLSVGQVNVDIKPANNLVPTDITISISNYEIDAVFTKINLSGKPRVTTAYLGRIVCSTCVIK